MKSSPAWLSFAIAMCVGLLPSAVHADPLVITRGNLSAQTWDEMGASFQDPIQLGILTTRSGLDTRFYLPGQSAELSNHIQLGIGDVELIGAFDGPGAIDFRFTTGTTVQLPPGPVPADINTPYYLTYTAPFVFSGEVLGYDQAGKVIFARDLRGTGTSEFIFHGVTRPFAEREGYFLTDTRFSFSAAQPVPEPRTILMVMAGLAVLVTSRSRRTGVTPQSPARACDNAGPTDVSR